MACAKCYTQPCYNKALTRPLGLSVFSVERSVWEARTGQPLQAHLTGLPRQAGR